jgi:hypothetical protein
MQSEAELLQHTRMLLTLLKTAGLLTYRRIHVGPMLVRGRQFPNHDMRGMADILVFLKNDTATTLHLELKSADGKLRKEQADWARELATMGHFYYAIQSIGELETVLQKHGVRHFSFKRETDEKQGTADSLSGGVVHD